MKRSEAFWMFLPAGLVKLFGLVGFERTDQSYDIWLDGKKLKSEEDRRNPDTVARRYPGLCHGVNFVQLNRCIE